MFPIRAVLESVFGVGCGLGDTYFGHGDEMVANTIRNGDIDREGKILGSDENIQYVAIGHE